MFIWTYNTQNNGFFDILIDFFYSLLLLLDLKQFNPQGLPFFLRIATQFFLVDTSSPVPSKVLMINSVKIQAHDGREKGEAAFFTFSTSLCHFKVLWNICLNLYREHVFHTSCLGCVGFFPNKISIIRFMYKTDWISFQPGQLMLQNMVYIILFT